MENIKNLFYFTIIFSVFQISSVCAERSVEAQRIFKDSECAGEIYQLGHEYAEHFQECNQVLIDKNLPYEDYNWIFYSCIVKKSISDPDLNLKSYVKLMSRNLSESKQEAILDHLNITATDEESISTEEPEVTEMFPEVYRESYVEKLKTYWKLYFDAEFQVCGAKYRGNCEKIKRNKCDLEDCIEKARNFSEPLLFCSNFRTSSLHPTSYTKVQHEDCVLRWITTLTLFTYNHAKSFAESICFVEGISILHPETFYTPAINFRTLYRKLIGGFLPATIRKLLFIEFRHTLRTNEKIILDDASPFKTFSAKVQQKYKLVKWAKNVKAEKTNEKHAILNYFSITTLIRSINRARKAFCKKT